MQISDCMRTTVYMIGPEATLHEAMQLMAQHMIGTLPVVDDDKHILGVVVLDDILTCFMPKFVELLRSTDFVHDFGILEAGRRAAHLTEQPITEIMRPPYSIAANSGLMAAMVMMHKHQFTDAPVVNEDGQLVGLVSNVRIASMFLMEWTNHLADES